MTLSSRALAPQTVIEATDAEQARVHLVGIVEKFERMLVKAREVVARSNSLTTAQITVAQQRAEAVGRPTRAASPPRAAPLAAHLRGTPHDHAFARLREPARCHQRQPRPRRGIRGQLPRRQPRPASGTPPGRSSTVLLPPTRTCSRCRCGTQECPTSSSSGST